MAGWGAYGSNPKANPFADDAEAKFGNPGSNGAWDIPLRDTDEPAPAALPAPTGAAGASASAGGGGGVSSWFGKKKGTAAAVPMTKEEELAVREAELKRREAELTTLARGNAKNWPWFWPWLYHDISVEVPSWNRNMVRFAYLGWLLGFVGWLVNLVVAMILMFSKFNNEITVKNFFLILLCTVIGLPLSFFMWYRSLYFAAQSDGSIYRYTKTFLFIILQLGWNAVVIISPPITNWAKQCGILTMTDLFNKGGSKGYAYGVMCVINVVAWGLSSFIIFVTLGAAVRAMRAGAQPRQEFEIRNLGSVRV